MGCDGKFAPAEGTRRFLKLVALHLTRAESLQTVEAVPRQAMPLVTSAIKARFAELWPHAIVWLGIVLSIAWSGSLAWLLLWLLDAV